MKTKRFLAVLLCMAMVLGTMSIPVFADETEAAPDIVEAIAETEAVSETEEVTAVEEANEADEDIIATEDTPSEEVVLLALEAGHFEVDNLADLKTACATGGEIKLTGDIDVAQNDLPIEVTADVTIDLNGYALKATTKSTSKKQMFSNGKNMIIEDNSEGQNGSITFNVKTGSTSAYLFDMSIKRGKIVTINSGTINLNLDASSGYVGNGYSGAGYRINGGEINVNYTNSSDKMIYVFQGGSEATMNGGKINVNAPTPASGDNTCRVQVFNVTNTKLYGGEVNVYVDKAGKPSGNSNLWSTTVQLMGGGDVYGGTYNLNVKKGYGVGVSSAANIHGGTFYLNHETTDHEYLVSDYSNAQPYITVSGGNFDRNPCDMYNHNYVSGDWTPILVKLAEGYCVKADSDGRYSVVEGSAIIDSTAYATVADAVAAAQEGDIIVINKNVDEAIASSGKGIINLNGHTVGIVSGGTFTGDVSALVTAEGYAAVNSEDGTCTVKPIENAVTEIETKNENGKTVTVVDFEKTADTQVKDEVDVTIPEGGAVMTEIKGAETTVFENVQELVDEVAENADEDTKITVEYVLDVKYEEATDEKIVVDITPTLIAKDEEGVELGKKQLSLADESTTVKFYTGKSGGTVLKVYHKADGAIEEEYIADVTVGADGYAEFTTTKGFSQYIANTAMATNTTTGATYETAQAAIDAANQNDVIKLAPGTHKPFFVTKADITVEGADNYASVIETNYDGSPTQVWDGGGGVRIQAPNFKISGVKFDCKGVVQSFSAPISRGNESDNHYDGNGIVIEDCMFVCTDGDEFYEGCAISLPGVTDITVDRCVITGFKTGIYAEGARENANISATFTDNEINVSDEGVAVNFTPYYKTGVTPGTVTMTGNNTNGDLVVWDYGVTKDGDDITVEKIVLDENEADETFVYNINSVKTEIDADKEDYTYMYANRGKETAADIAGAKAPKYQVVYVEGAQSDEPYIRGAEVRSLNIYINDEKVNDEETGVVGEVKAEDIIEVDVKVEDLAVSSARWTLTYDTEKFDLVSELEEGFGKELVAGTITDSVDAENAGTDNVYGVGEVLRTYKFKAKAIAIGENGETADFTISNTYAGTTLEDANNLDIEAANNDTLTVLFPSVKRQVIVKVDDTVVTTDKYEIPYDGEKHNVTVVTEPLSNVKVTIKDEDGKELTGKELDLVKSGEYVVTYEVPAGDGFGGETKTFTLTIGAPEYKVEVNTGEYYRADYVLGKKLVLVYTNADLVYFTYDNNLMIDVTKRGYKFNNVESYEHVYAYVADGKEAVDGYHNVDCEHEKLYKHDKVTHCFGTAPYAIDVYDNDMTYNNGVVDKNDITSVFSTYRVGELFYDAENDTAEDKIAKYQYMKQILKADTDGNKYINGVDTNSVVSEAYSK